MIQSLRSILLLSAGLYLLFLPSCALFNELKKSNPVASPEWRVKTYYLIEDITPEIGNRIIQEIETRMLIAPNNIQKLSEAEITALGASPKSFGFVILEGAIADMATLSRIQKTISSLSAKEVVPVTLTNAILNFQSVSGDATTKITISGDASEGSTIKIDDGSGKTIITSVDAQGKWSAVVNNNDKLSERGGIVYIQISKGTAVQYLEMNVLSKKTRRIERNELPLDVLLR